MSDPDLKELLLTAPDSQLAPNIKPMIQEWSTPATALQLLETLDAVIHGGAASSMVVVVLETMLNEAMLLEKVDIAVLVEKATWRHNVF